MAEDQFFTANYCQRCRKSLEDGRIMSWFTDEVICMDCSDSEDIIKLRMRKLGYDPSNYEGCSYVPTLKRLREDENVSRVSGVG